MDEVARLAPRDACESIRLRGEVRFDRVVSGARRCDEGVVEPASACLRALEIAELPDDESRRRPNESIRLEESRFVTTGPNRFCRRSREASGLLLERVESDDREESSPHWGNLSH